MKQFKSLLLIILLIGVSSFQVDNEGFSKLNNIDSFLVKVHKYAFETNTIKSDFVQEKHLTILDEILISEGHFIFQKDNNVLWEYNKPIDYAIIVHSGKFIIRDGDKVNEFDIESNRMFKEINNLIVTSVSGNFIDSPDFKNAYFENEIYYLVQLTPLKPEVKDMLATIEIYFDKKDISVSKVKFIEPGEDFTLINFFNKELNPKISEEVFTITSN